MENNILTKKEKRALAKENKEKARTRKSTTESLRKLFMVLIIVGFLGWFGYRGYKFIMTPTGSIDTETLVILDDDRVKGQRDAQVVLVEYGDFECPACAGYSEIVNQLYREYEDNLAVVYRHFPLVQTHKNAMISAKASEAAGVQDKFWEMHDLLYQRQDEWAKERDPKDIFAGYAVELGLDKERFMADLESSQIEEKVNANLVSARALNLNSTPSFFVNGTPVYNPRGYDSLKKAIETALEQ